MSVIGPKRRIRHVRFSNRPFRVKRFQAIHHHSVNVARGLVLLFGIGTKALPSWDSKTRWNDLLVGNAIQSGAIGRIAICFIEWSGEIFQTVVTSWTLIRDAQDARRFADKIIEAPRLFAENTSISTAIRFATAQIEHAPFRSERRVIDLSGDGVNNAGGSVAPARDEAVAK